VIVGVGIGSAGGREEERRGRKVFAEVQRRGGLGKRKKGERGEEKTRLAEDGQAVAPGLTQGESGRKL